MIGESSQIRVRSSRSHWLLASGAELVDFEVVADALLMEEMRAGQVGAHGAARKLLVAGQASSSSHSYISCSPP